MTVISV